MSRIRTAVVGVGHQGRWHADKFAALEHSKLVAVVDTDGDRCREVASELGVAAVSDYRDLIGEVDAVSIATPNPSHYDIVGTFLANGIHVLVEKPLTSTLEEARELVELSERKGLILQVGHLERFNPAVMAVAPHVGNPRFIESLRISTFKPRGLDVSVVLDLMIHDIDLIHSFTRSRMVEADAVGKSVFTDHIDIANARITFANGCIANVTSSRVSLKTERALRIFETNAYFSVDLLNKESTLCRAKGSGPVDSPEDISVEKWTSESGDALLEQSKAFLNSVGGGPPPLVSGHIAMEALETAVAIADRIELQ